MIDREWFHDVYQGDDAGAVDRARGLVWCEVPSSRHRFTHIRHVETVGGIGVWYCYGSDTYHFSDEEGTACGRQSK